MVLTEIYFLMTSSFFWGSVFFGKIWVSSYPCCIHLLELEFEEVTHVTHACLSLLITTERSGLFIDKLYV